MTIRGLIFDLDGTLVDSRLDFDRMRREMGLPAQSPLLEAIARLTAAEAERCRAILARHEQQGAQCATLLPGVREFLGALRERGLPTAVFTRNSRGTALGTLARLDLRLDLIVSRDDAPVKPDPAAIWMICDIWGCQPAECLVIGDYRYDIEAGLRAGARTVLYTGSGQESGLLAGETADFELESFAEPGELWNWMAQIDLEGDQRTC